MNKHTYIYLLILSLIFGIQLSAQDQNNGDFIQLYNDGKTDEALNILQTKITAVYEMRNTEQRVPTDFITIKPKQEKKDINLLFRNRKAKGFFIEENEEIFNLHLYAARCYYKKHNINAALDHYYQCLRFKPFSYDKDDAIAYEMAQVYKTANYTDAYHRFLEAAYGYNSSNYDYSLELGTALSATDKKRAVYHLERYVQANENKLQDYKIYLLIGNLYEDLAKYLETKKYYKKYLEKSDNDGAAWFALGILSFKRVGDYQLAMQCFNKAVSLLPETEIFRKSKSYESIADMYMFDLEFEKAVENYLQTAKYQDAVLNGINIKKAEIKDTDKKIADTKLSLRKDKQYNTYLEYESLLNKKGVLEKDLREQNYEFSKLNSGKIRWNLAECMEKTKRLDKAIAYYREAISYDYNSDSAREKILKLQLKINRGY